MQTVTVIVQVRVRVRVRVSANSGGHCAGQGYVFSYGSGDG